MMARRITVPWACVSLAINGYTGRMRSIRLPCMITEMAGRHVSITGGGGSRAASFPSPHGNPLRLFAALVLPGVQTPWISTGGLAPMPVSGVIDVGMLRGETNVRSLAILIAFDVGEL